jgi:uncharacterized protein YndB with AHSA1/START domain
MLESPEIWSKEEKTKFVRYQPSMRLDLKRNLFNERRYTMSTFTVTTMINRPVQEVFDFMTNPANSTKWQNGTESAKWASEGPVGAGSVMHTVGRMMGREFVMDAEITQWDPPRLWGLKSNSGPIKFEGTNKFESKDGGTLIVQNFEGQMGGFLKLAEGLAVKQMEKQIAADGNKLKMLLEGKI